MLSNSPAFSGFSVNDIDAAKDFYSNTLGLNVEQDAMGLHIKFDSGAEVFVYAKPNHEPASFTILNFPVENVEATVDELTAKGVRFEHYDFGPDMKTNEKGIMPGSPGEGPEIAWFKDPAGNTLAVLHNL